MQEKHGITIARNSALNMRLNCLMIILTQSASKSPRKAKQSKE